MRNELKRRGREAPVAFEDGKLTVDTAALSKGVNVAMTDSAASLRSASGGVQRALAEARVWLGLGRPPPRLRALAPPAPRATVVVGTGPCGAPRATVLARQSAATAQSPLGGLLLLLLAAVAALAVAKGGDRRRERDGKWVRDRSLGGRMVRVQSAAQSFAPPANRWRRTADLHAGGNPLDDEIPATSTAPAHRAGKAYDDPAPPAWWQEPAPVYGAGEARISAAKADARAAIARLNAARVGGASYDAADYLRLRAAGATAACAVEVTAGSSARDALYRGAVELVLREAATPSGALQGADLGALLSGLACDLGVPVARAGTLVAGCEAAAMRAALLDSLAQLRREGTSSLGVQQRLQQLAAQLVALPLPADAAEVELVAAGLESRCSAAERFQLHALFRDGQGSGAAEATVRAALAPLH